LEANIVLLPGDGIGPEVVDQAVRVLEAVGQQHGHRFNTSTYLIGGCSIDRYGTPLTKEALQACQTADAVFLGAVGGPQWDDPLAAVRPEQGLLELRMGMGVYANLRPVRVYPGLASFSPLKAEKLHGIDILVIRELTGGLYFGQPRGREMVDGHTRVVDTLVYYDYEIRRVIELAFRLAKGRRNKVTSVDKANVLESSRLWRQIAIETGSQNSTVTLEHMLVDAAAMRLVMDPSRFDVLVTENMFGDILTDEASVLAGSIGMLPSASLGDGKPGLYEPIHGSAPDIAGKGIANPVGAILSAALLLRYSLGLDREAVLIETAVEQAVSTGYRTADLNGTCTTSQMGEVIIEKLFIPLDREETRSST